MRYNELVVWQKAMDLVTEIYKITAMFPSDERFGLSSQARRAAVSIPSNIAEGRGRKATGAYINHLSIAHGSLMELELKQMDEIAKILNSLKKSLSAKEE